MFVGFDSGDKPRYAMLRGTSASTTFMMDVSGSDKRFSFSISENEKADTVRLFESAIDMLSFATLMKQKGRDWMEYNYLSLAGIYLPKKNISESTIPLALAQHLKDNPNIRRIVLCLDSDLAGRESSRAISAILGGKYIIEDTPPAKGKDYNDMLMIQRGIHKKQDIAR